MSEYRQDPATGDWVIIAPERGKRPGSARRDGPKAGELPSLDIHCPFCPGNEDMTPPEILRIPESPVWQVRVVPNKFGAVSPSSTVPEIRRDGLLATVNGRGIHEVIIETPDHSRQMASMEPGEVAHVLRAYRQRYEAVRHVNGIRMVVLFRNQGAEAGASLAHPHSQLIATVVMPPSAQRRHQVAQRYYGETGRCLYCRILDTESQSGVGSGISINSVAPEDAAASLRQRLHAMSG